VTPGRRLKLHFTDVPLVPMLSARHRFESYISSTDFNTYFDWLTPNNLRNLNRVELAHMPAHWWTAMGNRDNLYNFFASKNFWPKHLIIEIEHNRDGIDFDQFDLKWLQVLSDHEYMACLSQFRLVLMVLGWARPGLLSDMKDRAKAIGGKFLEFVEEERDTLVFCTPHSKRPQVRSVSLANRPARSKAEKPKKKVEQRGGRRGCGSIVLDRVEQERRDAVEAARKEMLYRWWRTNSLLLMHPE